MADRREYDDMVTSINKHSRLLSQVRAARGPSAKQIAAHKKDLEETARQLRKKK